MTDETRMSKSAVTRVRERPGFPIRNKFELPKEGMIETQLSRAFDLKHSVIVSDFVLRDSNFPTVRQTARSPNHGKFRRTRVTTFNPNGAIAFS